MAEQLEQQRARVAELQGQVDLYAPRDTMDLALYKKKMAGLKAYKDDLLLQERNRLAQEMQMKLQVERQMLHTQLSRELHFRVKADATSRGGKDPTFGGLLNPPQQGHHVKSEAFIKAQSDFKCTGDETIPGYTVTRVLGAVSGCAYIAGHAGDDLSHVDTTRGERSEAVNLLIETALARGANAVIGLKFDTSAPLGTDHIEVVAYATAVNIKRGTAKDTFHDGDKKQVSFKDESLHEMPKRLLSDEEGGNKKKGKQQPEPTEVEVSFSQIDAVMQLLRGKGGGGQGNGRNNSSSGGGWSSGNNNNSGGWGDTSSGGAGGGNDNHNSSWGNTDGWGGGSGGNNSSSNNQSWNSGNNSGNNWGGAQWGDDNKQTSDNWGARNDYNNDDRNDEAWGGGGGGYGGRDDDRNRRRARSPDPISPREMAFMISDLVRRTRKPSGSRRQYSDEGQRRNVASPMFGWELF